jgi:FHS family glucose/mannose:H+ symporter-like MFS transporter
MPFLVSWLIGLDAWIAAFPILGVSALLLAVCWMFMSFRSFNDLLSRKAARAAAAQKRTVERNPVASGQGRSSAKLAVFALCALFYLLYGGTEVSLIQFLPSVFMEQRSASSSTASAVLSVYWIGMTIGRTATGLLADKFGYYRFLLVSTIGAVIALGLLALGGGLGGGVVLAFLVGLFMSGMFAIALIFANSRLPGHTDRTTSLLMAVNGLGGALLPYVSGWTMDLLPVQMTVWLLTGCMALMLGFLVLIRQTDKMAPNAVESLQ